MFDEYQGQLAEINHAIRKLATAEPELTSLKVAKTWFTELKMLLKRKQQIEYTMTQMAIWR